MGKVIEFPKPKKLTEEKYGVTFKGHVALLMAEKGVACSDIVALMSNPEFIGAIASWLVDEGYCLPNPERVTIKWMDDDECS